MRIKMSKSVSLCGVKPEVMMCLSVVLSAAEKLGADECYISSARDGKHSTGSRHYMGMALDFDVPRWDAVDMSKWALEVRNNLSGEFDVIDHASHLHVEYDPKNNTRV